jgi:hypothetical protein
MEELNLGILLKNLKDKFLFYFFLVFIKEIFYFIDFFLLIFFLA